MGGKNKLPMAELKLLFEKAGCERVRTYIASGNVVFDAPTKVASKLADVVAAAIEKQFGLRVPVVIRSADEMARVARENPFLKMEADSLFVMFLAVVPNPKAVAGLDAERSPGDRFQVRGRDIFMTLTTGAADTKLTNAYFDAKLKTVSTSRNWRTVLKLVEMCAQEE